jgi:hypothetical protein
MNYTQAFQSVNLLALLTWLFIIFLPNIFTYSNIYSKYDNHSNYAFIKINYEKLLMIPGYLISFYINNNIIYDIQLNIININIINNNKFITKIKTHRLIKMLNFMKYSYFSIFILNNIYVI